MNFDVTYEIVTPESAKDCDVEECGYISEGVSLRDAISAVQTTRTCHIDGVECVETDEYPVRAPRWVTVTNSMEYLTGAQESRSLHMPVGLTPSTRLRIARHLGVKC